MRWLKRLFSTFKPAEEFWLEVECEKCGERIRVRIDKKWELCPEYREDVSHTLHKEIRGRKCPNLIHIFMEFNSSGKVLSRTIEGGKLLEGT